MNEKPEREDGRRPLLVYMKPELIRFLKSKAAMEDTHVYHLVEELVEGLTKSESSPDSKTPS